MGNCCWATTKVFSEIVDGMVDPSVKVIALEGGTSSSKTYSALQAITLYLSNAKKPELWSVASESVPHLKRGPIRDFVTIMGPLFDSKRYNKADMIYTFPSGAKLEFISATQPDKLRGPRRDGLYGNEVNNWPKSARDQLSVRTRGLEIYDWNPVGEFYFHEEVIPLKSTKYIHSTYRDALDVIDPQVVEKIESRKETDPNWWRVYGLGLVGNVVGLVHPLFDQVKAMPDGGEEFFGLDFGFSPDPAALTHNKIKGKDLYSDLLLYESGMTNEDLSERMDSLGLERHVDVIYADSAEPKSIEELRRMGWLVKPAPKGSDSVRAGIQLVNQYRQHWTERSLDAIKEQRNYRYITDVNDKPTSKPIDNNNHAMDSRRYAVVGHNKTKGVRAVRSNI